MKRHQANWRRREDQVSPLGVPYSDVTRQNICLERGCSQDEAAAAVGVSEHREPRLEAIAHDRLLIRAAALRRQQADT